MAFYQFRKEQIVNTTVEIMWDFISAPQNLKEITPKYMGFDILSTHLPKKIYEGMIISYAVKPLLGIKTNWVTEITHIKDRSYFVDEQRIGPYKMWHHQHILKAHGDQVLMVDIVSYQVPFFFLGRLAHRWFIKNTLNEIFDYRTQVLEQKFPKSSL